MQNRQNLQFPLVWCESIPQTSMLKSQFNSIKACLQPATETFGVSMDIFSLHSNCNLDTVKPPSVNTSERLFPNPVSQVTFALFVAMIIFCLRAAKTNSQHIKHVTFLLFTTFRKANPLLLCPLVIVRAIISYVTDLYVAASKCSSVGRCAWLTYKISPHVHASRYPEAQPVGDLCATVNGIWPSTMIYFYLCPSRSALLHRWHLKHWCCWWERCEAPGWAGTGTCTGQEEDRLTGKTQDTSTAYTRICCATDLVRVCRMSAPVWLQRLAKPLEKFQKQDGNSHASKHKLHIIIWKFWAA